MNNHNINISKYITVDPLVCHGKPCFKGTRIMAYLVLEMLAAGETPAEIIKAYPQLNEKSIEAALFFAASNLKGGEKFVSFSQKHVVKVHR